MLPIPPDCREHSLEDRPIEAAGFKTKPGDIEDRDTFIHYLRRNQFKIIHLSRRNSLKQALSAFTARRLRDKTGCFNATDISDIQGAIHVDPEELLQRIDAPQFFHSPLAPTGTASPSKSHAI